MMRHRVPSHRTSRDEDRYLFAGWKWSLIVAAAAALAISAAVSFPNKHSDSANSAPAATAPPTQFMREGAEQETEGAASRYVKPSPLASPAGKKRIGAKEAVSVSAPLAPASQVDTPTESQASFVE